MRHKNLSRIDIEREPTTNENGALVMIEREWSLVANEDGTIGEFSQEQKCEEKSHEVERHTIA